MSYNIKFDDITSVQVETQKTMNAWGESMSSLNKAMNDFIKNQNLQGQAISSMRTYLVEVHGTLLQTLANLMNDYSTNLLLYKDGYYQIDGDLHTKLPGKEFTRLHSDLKGSRDKLKPEIELLKTTKSDISDLVSYEGSSHTSTVMNYNFLMNQLKNLDNSITQYESSHSGQDLVAFKELLAATKALIAEHSGKSRNVGTYQSGDFGKLKSVQRFAIAYDQAAKQMESRVERVKAAQERDKVRFEALAAEDRAKKGWIDLGIGVFTAVIGIVAIVSTMGAATPLVVAGGVVGFGTSVYGLSNAEEGVHNIALGNAGDIQTKARNPIRDTVFMGNDKLYHDVGNTFVIASAIMIPIGKTQSVVQGLTEFAIGEAGAYTAGQTAYHVTKLAGGSEEDAQTANFLGNLIGGYTASSAASKFSLNKVKVDVPSAKPSHLDVPLQGKQIPNLDPANVRLSSRPDLHLKASPAEGTLAKLKPHPTVSEDVPKVKQIYADYNDYVSQKISSGEKPLSMSDWKLKVNNLKQNQTVGKEFKVAQTENFKQIASHVENRITIATTVDGQIKKVQVDAIGFDSNGKIRIQDYTASSNISSKRQAILDNIERNGGVIVGKGKGKFVGGVEIPKGTRIDVVNSSNQKIENFKMELEKLPHAKLSAEDSASILELKNGERPKPEEIYSKSDIETHLSLFDGGVVKVMSKESFNDANKRFGGSIGHPNGQYVLPKSVYEQALKASNGDPRVLEELLALESGYLGDSPVLIDIKNYQNIRMPSGNEPGAWDGLWVPGGYTKGGIPEAVIDQIQKGDYLISNIFQ